MARVGRGDLTPRIDVLTTGGIIHVSVSTMHENGELPLDDDFRAGDALVALRQHIQNGNSVTTTKHECALVDPQAVIALVYKGERAR